MTFFIGKSEPISAIKIAKNKVIGITIKEKLIKCEKIKYAIICEIKYPKTTPTKDENIATITLPRAKFR